MWTARAGEWESGLRAKGGRWLKRVWMYFVLRWDGDDDDYGGGGDYDDVDDDD